MASISSMLRAPAAASMMLLKLADPLSAADAPVSIEAPPRNGVPTSFESPQSQVGKVLSIQEDQYDAQDRAKIIEKYEAVLPKDTQKRESFIERSRSLTNGDLKTLLAATKFLKEQNLLNATMIERLFASRSLYKAGCIASDAANVAKSGLFKGQRVTREEIIAFLSTNIGLLDIVSFEPSQASTEADTVFASAK